MLSEEERMEICAIAEKKFLSDFTEGSYEESINMFQTCYIDASKLVERLENGEIIDQMCLKASIQKMIYAFRHAQKKKRERCGGHLLDPDSIFVPGDAVEAAILANKAIGNYALTGNPDEYETGMWIRNIAEI